MKNKKEEIVEYYKGKDSGSVYNDRRYGGRAGDYRQNLIRQNIESALVASGLRSGKKKVLELAPGSGALTKILLKEFPEPSLTVIDSSPRMLESLKNDLEPFIEKGFLKTTLGDAESLPFLNSEFDLVFSLRLFIHYREIEGFLREIKRVLKPGGLAVVDAHNFFRLDLPNVLYRRFVNPRGFLGLVPSYYLFPWELKDRYSVPGLVVCETIGHKFLPPLRFLLRLLGQDSLLRVEKIVSTSWLKYFCADMYIVLRKDGPEK